MSAITTDSIAALRASHLDCFACGPSKDFGLGLQFELDSEGTASTVWQPSARFQSYPGRLHGGIIATLMDCAMVHAVFAQGIAGVTAEMTIRYRHPVNTQEPMTISGRIVAERHGILVCQADLHQGDLHAAHASAKFMPA